MHDLQAGNDAFNIIKLLSVPLMKHMCAKYVCSANRPRDEVDLI